MSQVLDKFLEFAKAGDWKNAFTYCNGLNMYETCLGLYKIGPDRLRDMRAQMAIHAVEFGPNMPRIEYAMEVVRQGKASPKTEFGFSPPKDQLQEAERFLRETRPNKGTAAKKLKVAFYWTQRARNETMSANLVQGAQDILHKHGNRFILDVKPQRHVLVYYRDVDDSDDMEEVYSLAQTAGASGRDRLTVIFCTVTQIACQERRPCPKSPYGTTPADRQGRNYVLINTSKANPDRLTLLHEMGHAAGIEPSDDRETDDKNFMSWGTSRTDIREGQLAKFEKAIFCS